MNYFLLYLFTRLDPFYIAMVACMFISLSAIPVCIFIGTVVASDLNDDDGKKLSELSAKWMDRFIISSVIFSIIVLITPTKEDVMFIVGGKIGIDLTQSKQVEETSVKLYKLLQKKLDEELVE